MTLSISNIAWDADDDEPVASELQELGVTRVELAPTKVFADPTRVSAAEARACVASWAAHGITIGSFQSLLFGRPDLRLFGDDDVRTDTIEHISRFLDLAAALGARHLVFGSPKNRTVPAGMSPLEADDIAARFFGELGRRAADSGTVLCIEPNPAEYDCNYVTTASAGAALVRRVASPGFRLHLDAAGMALSGDDPRASISASRDVLAHYHASAPYLGALEDQFVDHGAAARALAEAGYTGDVAIEMRGVAGAPAVERVRAAVTFARRYYEAA